MKASIFDYRNYKSYLRDALKIKERTDGSRGLRSRLAEAAQCHTAYVSQVLNGSAHFSLEQAELISRFLGHTADETTYFLLLIQHNRAGTSGLKAHFATHLDAVAKKQLILKERLEYQRRLSSEDQVIYYSSWHYGAIHVLVSVPGCNTEKGISDYLGLSIERVVEALGFLARVGLVEKKEGRYMIGSGRIHLEHDSPMISKHHTNWRIMAIRALDEARADDLHYSSIITCSLEDSHKIKSALVHAIDQVRAIVKPSRDEGAFVYCLDFFGLKSGKKPGE